MERYIGYLCDMYYKLLEIDFDLHTYKQYQKKNNIVEIKEYANIKDFDISSVYPDDVAEVQKIFSLDAVQALFLSGNDENYIEIRMKSENGAYHWYSFIFKLIPIDVDHPCSIMLLIKDIDTIHCERERLRNDLVQALDIANAASRSKSTFLSSMSHEIRTPLNAVIGYMTVAENSIDNKEKLLHCISSAGIAARHLLSIINNVLDISSMESGKMKLAHERFDLKEQLSDITAVFYQQCKQKNLAFSIFVDGLSEEWVSGDSMRVNQILMNLMSNAVKFTDDGGVVQLSVTQSILTDDKVFIRFEVKDTGIGMSSEYMNRLFLPFEQENALTAKQYGGTGLGMSITKNLVHMMGGEINVSSTQGVGTIFTVTLPFDRSENTKLILPPKDFSQVRILIVDDLENERDYVHALLTRCGVIVESVNSGEDAVLLVSERLKSDQCFDLCIIDWNMPGLNGVQTTKLIHEKCDRNIPVIIATAYDISEFEDDALAAGALKIISKPLFQSTLFDLLITMYGKYEVTKEKTMAIPDLTGVHVLLAEDNKMNIEVAVEILKTIGVTADIAHNGQEAVDLFLASGEIYDIILMDVQMPVMDGYDATKAIRSSNHSRASSIPIIAMTANAFAEDVSASLASGMNSHLSKPIDPAELFTVLQNYKGRK